MTESVVGDKALRLDIGNLPRKHKELFFSLLGVEQHNLEPRGRVALAVKEEIFKKVHVMTAEEVDNILKRNEAVRLPNDPIEFERSAGKGLLPGRGNFSADLAAPKEKED